jgi:Na+/H+ antiporter NhaD/arsenite permease-like protein
MERAFVNVLEALHPADVAAGSVDADTIRVACLLAHPSHSVLIKAVSCGSVFFGANTYIGNGPNFMVKAIADHAGVKMPSFLAYIWRFALPVMLPMVFVGSGSSHYLFVVWLAFFR